MQIRFLAGALLSLSLASAQAVVVDFDGIDIHSTVGLGPNGYSIKVNEPYQEDGFVLTSNFGYKIPVGLQAVTDRSPWWTGSPSLFNGWGPSAEYINATSLTRANGESFDLLAMDAAAFANNNRYFVVYGIVQGTGAVVSKQFLLDTSFTSMEALSFGNEFKNLSMASIYAWNARIDNIQLSYPGEGSPTTPVPEPASLALVLAGLLTVAGLRQRRASN